MKTIPVVDYPRFTEEVTIEGVLYVLTFNWNSRNKHWSLSISNRNGMLILAGIKIMNSIDVVGRYNRVALPNGIILPIFNNNDGSRRIEDGDLGVNVDLFYISEAESVSV